MKKFILSGIVAVGLYLGAIYLYGQGYYWLLGVGMACFGILGLTERWKKTHDVGYIFLLTVIYLGLLLSAFWLIPQGIVGPGFAFLLVIGGILVIVFQQIED